jgi:uncharacterized protein YecE (DUF72 family)
MCGCTVIKKNGGGIRSPGNARLFYPPASVRRFGAKIKQLAAMSPTMNFYIFFNNHARGQAVANALMLKSELASDPRCARRSARRSFSGFERFYRRRWAGALDPS